MAEDKLLAFASKRAALLNLSSEWGTDEDGVLLIQLITRIEQLTAEVERLREALTQIARLRTDLRGDFSLGSKQSDIARAALEGKQ